MNRNELLELFGDELISGKRVTLHALTSDKRDLLINYILGRLNVSEDIAALMKQECVEMLKDKYHIVFLIYSEANDFIGYTEFKNLDGTPEIGIDLAEKYQGKGYGFETCQVLVTNYSKKQITNISPTTHSNIIKRVLRLQKNLVPHISAVKAHLIC